MKVKWHSFILLIDWHSDNFVPGVYKERGARRRICWWEKAMWDVDDVVVVRLRGESVLAWVEQMKEVDYYDCYYSLPNSLPSCFQLYVLTGGYHSTACNLSQLALSLLLFLATFLPLTHLLSPILSVNRQKQPIHCRSQYTFFFSRLVSLHLY